ncbi:hypothetical protein GOODEAATRI_007543, partial [Goodea atripinnis]
SPLLAGTPAGTRNSNLSPRTTRNFPDVLPLKPGENVCPILSKTTAFLGEMRAVSPATDCNLCEMDVEARMHQPEILYVFLPSRGVIFSLSSG